MLTSATRNLVGEPLCSAAAVGPPAPTATPVHSFGSHGGQNARSPGSPNLGSLGRAGGGSRTETPLFLMHWGAGMVATITCEHQTVSFGLAGLTLALAGRSELRVWGPAVPPKFLLRYRVNRARPGHCGYQRSALNSPLHRSRVVGAMPKSWHSDLRFFFREFTSVWDGPVQREELWGTTTAELGQSSYAVSYKAGTVSESEPRTRLS